MRVLIRGTLICYFGQEGGRLFGGGRLLERRRLFEEMRYLSILSCFIANPNLF